jgi:hypothetical protein
VRQGKRPRFPDAFASICLRLVGTSVCGPLWFLGLSARTSRPALDEPVPGELILWQVFSAMYVTMLHWRKPLNGIFGSHTPGNSGFLILKFVARLLGRTPKPSRRVDLGADRSNPIPLRL